MGHDSWGGGVATWVYYNTDLAARSGAASRQALRAEHYFTLALREISKKISTPVKAWMLLLVEDICLLSILHINYIQKGN